MRQLKITKSITNRESASLDKYLQEIGRKELISVDEEVELAQRIRMGDQEARDKLVSAILSTGNDELLLVTRRGQALRISEEEVRSMGRTGRGVIGMKLSAGDEICAAIHVDESAKILVVTEKGIGKRVEFTEFSAHGRGTGGQRIFGNVDEKGEIIGALTIGDEDSVMCITSQGTSLRVEAKEISQQGRASSGVKIVDIVEPDYVVGIDRIAKGEED